MNLIIVLEALILGMVIFLIDFVVSRKGNEDDYEYTKENNSKIGSDGIVILISYLVISIFLYFFFKMQSIQNITYGRNSVSDFSFMADILKNISQVRGVLLNVLIGLYGIRRRRPEGFIFIVLSLAMPFLNHFFIVSNIFRFLSSLLRILIFRKNILMAIYSICNFLIITFLIFGNMYGSGDLFYRFISFSGFNLLFSNMYWVMVIAIIIEIIKIANTKNKEEL
ncbi:hypothetical protein [Fusobacterium sp.]|uniref:hypothetical protein n=1 Tax=Fusobacterium sp. TaxID=68766 RepID=UPI002902DFDB|nr:hypothetical protein [Fusobacterium sp.]MDU1911880.1 hypothetical protein [Fusobacterium sp.]